MAKQPGQHFENCLCAEHRPADEVECVHCGRTMPVTEMLSGRGATARCDRSHHGQHCPALRSAESQAA